MAALVGDPSQKKPVAALLIVLVGVIGITAARLKPAPAPKPAAGSREAASARHSAMATVDLACDVSRNPFQKPAAFETKESGSAEGDDPAQAPDDLKLSKFEPGPWPVYGTARPGDNQTASLAPGAAPAKPDPRPTFTLLATVANREGLSAVIRTGDSAGKVVEVGDRLEGGFKVVKLEAARAVLTDGRITIIATRPH